MCGNLSHWDLVRGWCVYPPLEATSNKETNVCIVLQMVVSKPHFSLRRPFQDLISGVGLRWIPLIALQWAMTDLGECDKI